MQRKFVYGQATITIHRTRNADELDAELITSMLMDEGERPVRDWHRTRRYADLLVSIDAVDGDPGVLIPPPDAPVDALRVGYEAWLNEAGLYRAWKAAYAVVNAPIGDVDSSPVADPKDEAART
jgi:hypothetical protein